MKKNLCLAALALICAPAFAKSSSTFDSGAISGLNARNIGSATMSGRIAAVTAYEKDGKTTIFVAAASGGVWKSPDGGVTYQPMFDHEAVQSIGAVTIDPSNPDTIWVGTGESWTRNSVSIGNGIYKSTDGGETWTNMGLPQSERIVKIIVHPKSSDTVYACVPGKLWSDSADRGLYKTTDGGKTWSLILKGSNLSTGCASASMDTKDPNTLYAALWDFRRKGWTFRSGGDNADAPSGSGLFKSTDGGKTWTEFTADANKGFATKPFGRISVAVAPSNPSVVYASIEAAKGSGFYRSGDGGKTWEPRDRSQFMVWRPFYFSNMTVDPKNENRVFKDGGSLLMSEDGGRSFSAIGGFAGMHGDVHDVWINPNNTQSVIAVDDGGIWYSHDGGSRWLKGENLPISQFYHVSVDEADPYRVYGGLQDNTSWVGDSQYPGGITNSRWENMFGGDGFWMFPDPSDPDYLYAELQGGFMGRVNRYTHEARILQPLAGYHEKMRLNWNTPIHISPNDKSTIYEGAQFLFRSRDHGQTWDRISPDLTTNDPNKQKQEESGGVTVDNSAAEMHTTIYSISESPKDKDLIWVGTDDGNVQITRDGGKSWKNVVDNVPNLPKNSWVSWVQASKFDEGTAYAAFDRHTFGDMDPYVYKTTDYGKSWKLIASKAQGLRGYAHVVKEDPVKSDLLFVGTEFGLWVSVDGGNRWVQYKGSHFPSVAVRDIVVAERDSDLVLATHGRGIWIIDDITPWRELSDSLMGKEAAFVKGRPQKQDLQAFSGGWAEGAGTFAGANPPDAAVITYWQKSRHLFGKIKIEILDADGKVIDDIPASKRRGLNRVLWSMRTKAPRVPPAAQVAGNAQQGPRVVPGTYTVRMTKNGQVYETKVDVVLDRRAKFSVAERKQNFDAAMRVSDLFAQESDVVAQINALRMSIAQRKAASASDAALTKALTDLDAKADDIRKKIVATKEGGAITGEERLREHTDNVYGPLLSYEGKPTQYQLDRIDVIARELGEVQTDWKKLVAEQLPGLNDQLKQRGATPIEVSFAPADDAQAASANPATIVEAFDSLRLR
ncbi:MAG TPA: hypothetical protein VFB36_04275 [Nevskiaceae bacterium]|nr:hypothetical protein [Nevskiaceae bacterium]